MNNFVWFVLIGLVFGLFYSLRGDRMFDEFNVDRGFDREKAKRLKNAPWELKLERFWHRFIGVFLGWMFLWILLDLRLRLFSGNPDLSKLDLADFILFLLGYIGVNGKLPTIAHSIQDWLPKRSG